MAKIIHISFLSEKNKYRSPKDTDSSSSTISTAAMQNLVDRLRQERVRSTTKRNYYSVWKSFNEFFIRLDVKPNNWEERLILFVGYLVQENKKSQTIKSYISAIKNVLLDDRVVLNENKFLISSLTKACKYKNDHVRTRLPIKKKMLHMIINQIQTFFEGISQEYLSKMYSALVSTAYYGMFRVGELTTGDHPVLVNDVQIGQNKNKILFILRTSKTHGKYNHPQMIKICQKGKFMQKSPNQFCPYQLLREYITIRPKAKLVNEPFFIFRDYAPVTALNFRKTL